MLVPGDLDEWLEQSQEHLLVRRCAYWVCLPGDPEATTDTVTVKLPRSNILDVGQLLGMLQRIGNGGGRMRPEDSLDELPADLALSPSAVSSYLGSAGWSLEDAGQAATVWGLADGRGTRARLLLPLDRRYADFVPRFQEALRTLRLVHDWDLQRSADDLSWPEPVTYTADGTIDDGQVWIIQTGAREWWGTSPYESQRSRWSRGSAYR